MSTVQFLPSGYSIPSKSDQFMKLEQGENRIRVLGPAETGYLFFSSENKPVRKPEGDGEFTPEELAEFSIREGERPKYFWAFPVWNYAKERVQVLELTQRSIQKPILGYFQDEDYGDPTGYDLIIGKNGEGLNTEYTVRAKPPKDAAPEIAEVFGAMKVDVSALFRNEYPIS